jgi:GMP synthase-like glutamine amidotransferase
MKIGIIQTGAVRDALAESYGEYPAMFEAMMGATAPGLAFEAHALVDGAPLPPPGSADAWMITGSRHGVYDPIPWIEPLKAWLRAVREAGRPIVGICFGHQIMAEAFGGRAVKFDGGWRIGVHNFRVTADTPWLDDTDAFSLHSIHQDQVVAIPDDATVWATSPGCLYAGLAYGDPDRPDAISIQPHPEFTPPFMQALVSELHADGRVPADLGTAALAQIGRDPVENRRVAGWFRRYLDLAAG